MGFYNFSRNFPKLFVRWLSVLTVVVAGVTASSSTLDSVVVPGGSVTGVQNTPSARAMNARITSSGDRPSFMRANGIDAFLLQAPNGPLPPKQSSTSTTTVSVKDFGAAGDGSTDDTNA